MPAFSGLPAAEGKSPLALGIRDNSIDVDVRIKREDGWEKLTLKFPECEQATATD